MGAMGQQRRRLGPGFPARACIFRAQQRFAPMYVGPQARQIGQFRGCFLAAWGGMRPLNLADCPFPVVMQGVRWDRGQGCEEGVVGKLEPLKTLQTRRFRGPRMPWASTWLGPFSPAAAANPWKMQALSGTGRQGWAR